MCWLPRSAKAMRRSRRTRPPPSPSSGAGSTTRSASFWTSSANADGTLSALYDGGAETLSVGADGVAHGLDTALTREAGGLRIDRPGDAIHSLARPVAEGEADAIDGIYRSAELESEFEIVNAGGSWFGAFTGVLGRGPLMPMAPVGPGLWRLVCHRSLDAPAPGDWTVRVRRSADGRPETLSVGCWLARDVGFRATSSL